MKSAIIYNGGSFFFDLDREAFESSGAFDRSLYLMGIGACFDGGRFASVSRLFGQQTLFRKGTPSRSRRKSVVTFSRRTALREVDEWA